MRNEALVRDGDDGVCLVIARSRGVTAIHRRRETCLGLGDATVLKADAPGRLGSRESFEVDAVMISPEVLAERNVEIDGVLARRLHCGADALGLLRCYLRHFNKGFSDGREMISRHINDLTALVISARPPIGESSIGGVAAARLACALAEIEARFADPDLSLESVARRMKISQRYLGAS